MGVEREGKRQEKANSIEVMDSWRRRAFYMRAKKIFREKRTSTTGEIRGALMAEKAS